MPKDSKNPASTALLNRLSKNIAARRSELGLTQAQLAERLGVDPETLSRFERGRHAPSLLTLERLACLLHTTAGELLAEAPRENSADAQIISSWLAGLEPEDCAFVRKLLKEWCDYLTQRKSAPPAR